MQVTSGVLCLELQHEAASDCQGTCHGICTYLKQCCVLILFAGIEVQYAHAPPCQLSRLSLLDNRVHVSLLCTHCILYYTVLYCTVQDVKYACSTKHQMHVYGLRRIFCRFISICSDPFNAWSLLTTGLGNACSNFCY